MSYRRRHRWFRRMVLGLAFSVAIFAGRTSNAAAKFDEGAGGSRYVSTGGWSGEVDMQSGVPVSAGIPEGDEQLVDPQAVQVIPYLSHGILTQTDARAATPVQPVNDPYLTDLFVRPGEAQAGPDGRSAQEWTVVPYLSHGILTESDAQAVAALDGDQVAISNAIASQQYVPGVTDLPAATTDTPAVRPDDVANRFAHSDVPTQPQVASSSGSTVEWNDALTAGVAALVLGLGLGLAFGRLNRPKLAGL